MLQCMKFCNGLFHDECINIMVFVMNFYINNRRITHNKTDYLMNYIRNKDQLYLICTFACWFSAMTNNSYY